MNGGHYQQISYITLIGVWVHSTNHLIHPRLVLNEINHVFWYYTGGFLLWRILFGLLEWRNWRQLSRLFGHSRHPPPLPHADWSKFEVGILFPEFQDYNSPMLPVYGVTINHCYYDIVILAAWSSIRPKYALNNSSILVNNHNNYWQLLVLQLSAASW